jgi:hypothetical protein
MENTNKPVLARLLFFSILIISALSCKVHPKSVAKPAPAAPPSRVVAHQFPHDWVGNWHGTLEIFSAKGTQTVPMWVEVGRLDTSTQRRYQFGLVYGSKEKDYRPYELLPIDTAKGIWAVDEKNSIVMEGYVRGPKYMSWFVVQGSRVLCIYELQDAETMLFEVVSGRETAVSTTGNTIQAGQDTIPAVQAYPIGVYQRAVLKRQ